MLIRFLSSKAAIAAAAALILTDVAIAGSCGGHVCWGAIGVGEDGRTARASNFRTAPEALEHARRVCLDKCDRIEVFHSGCGAIVTAGDAVFSGFSTDRNAAIQEAEDNCAATGEKSCRLRVWACTN